MTHTHDHAHTSGGHAHDVGDVGTTRLVLALVFNLAITLAEFIAGLVAGSLSLMADAAHNLSDTLSMGTSLVARRVATRAADRRRTFGYERAELIGAFINLLTLILIALYLLVEAVQRYLNPSPVDGTLMIWVGLATLVGNVATAAVLYKPSHDSLNIKSTFVHIVADALGSVAVVVGGVLIMQYGWTLIDPLLTAALACYILGHSYSLLKQTIRILMESAPAGFDFNGLVATMEAVGGVCDVHHVHVWQLDEHRTACEAHVVIEKHDLSAMEQIKQQLKQQMNDAHGIEHATLEFEFEPCGNARRVARSAHVHA
ncbi:cation diffusion facilitator family transporter [Salisaeta longa]|uniref:cation diffusion facilitator family transporter n=1 Tax=Salisaeta longa TaxID=503170 RepID=UPI0012F9E12F|nr:cation diffusion facilitator family transporter [Salisaeta longa]